MKKNNKVLIIAEIGVNHNGNEKTAINPKKKLRYLIFKPNI